MNITAPKSLPDWKTVEIDSLSSETVTVRSLCIQAGIRCRVSGGFHPVIKLGRFGGHFRGSDAENRSVLFVNTEKLPSETTERSIRILEILAHSFHDYAARESVRGLFV